MIRIGVIGDYKEEVKAHIAIPRALRLTAEELGLRVDCDWIPTTALADAHESKLVSYQALWIAPASPYASMQGALNGIRYARENRIPALGTCGGFQHMIIEFARDAMGLAEADHAEIRPESAMLIVTPLSCAFREHTHRFLLSPGSRTAAAYGALETIEQYGICNYGLNPAFAAQVSQAGFRIAGVDEAGETRIMELDGHPFFFGTLFQPERSAFKSFVHPLIRAFVQAAEAVPDIAAH
ncbi:CTP synthase C-terminal region-related (seleno)protein [Cohnella sp. JJ-181]|uniref:CTP synthase C-terminal region-related (seleno)protein n=1 Tax=Cohnella rhizoplanae TaxID=2974897 RepID=UPI0022FF9E1A|nr:hypothetical protein [Cohnella sp. JJ-181]CAI6082722.1 CTP synthase [Cohnella sp. JJ-181]